MKCDDCKHANWKRTANGRLHPNKGGICTFAKNVPIPASMPQFNLRNVLNRDTGSVEIRGGFIDRGHELKAPCPYFERTKP